MLVSCSIGSGPAVLAGGASFPTSVGRAGRAGSGEGSIGGSEGTGTVSVGITAVAGASVGCSGAGTVGGSAGRSGVEGIVAIGVVDGSTAVGPAVGSEVGPGVGTPTSVGAGVGVAGSAVGVAIAPCVGDG
jgi:hypothetical protein